MNADPIIEVENVVKVLGGRTVSNGVSFKVYPGETMIIMGGSGCGKSTLLRQIIGAIKPTSGSIKIFGQEITTLAEKDLGRLRRRFGMLFQSGALLQSLTVGENVALPIVEHSTVDPDIVDLIVKMKLELVGLNRLRRFETSRDQWRHEETGRARPRPGARSGNTFQR